jgi:hypothetical protein
LIEQRLPIIARWMLFALGATEGHRIRRPIDPVAAWLLRNYPGLLPTVPQPALLTTIRARTDLVDRMLGEEVHRAQLGGQALAYWAFGGGFDARWLRLESVFAGVVREHREVDTEAILDLKSRMLGESPYHAGWVRVRSRAVPETAWTVEPSGRLVPLVVMEASLGRLDEDTLRVTLQRLRADAPEARVICGLPALGAGADRRWSVRNLAALGWRVDEDVQLGPRTRLLGNVGQEMCAGMYPFRIVRLSARESLQV